MQSLWCRRLLLTARFGREATTSSLVAVTSLEVNSWRYDFGGGAVSVRLGGVRLGAVNLPKRVRRTCLARPEYTVFLLG
jgi:hypothetical protein